MNHISAKELAQRLQQKENWLLLDVRQPEEWQICNLSHCGEALLVPLNSLAGLHQKIPAHKPIVVYCHHGIRSQHAIAYLQQQGFQQLYNLSGGIHAWAQEVEPAMERY